MKHKKLFICLGVLLVLFIIAIIGIKKLVYPDDSISKYGDRLNGINDPNIKISKETENEIESMFLSNENVTNFDYELTGKIIKVFITVKEDTKLDTVKELSDIILRNLTDDQKNFYDISYSVECDCENELYPIMGSKHRTANVFSWTIKNIEKGEENAE